MRALFAVPVAFAVLASACADDDSSVGPPGTVPGASVPTVVPDTTVTTVPSTGSTTVAPAPTTTTPARPRLDDVAVTLVEVARADRPIALVTDPATGDAYLAERVGRVRPIDLATGALGDPIVDISDRTRAEGERGLLGVAFSPDGGRVYLSSTSIAGDTFLDELDRATGKIRTVLTVEQPAGNHNGGHVVFGPDGHLYLGLGDGGGAGDPFRTAQDPGSLLGAILRLAPTGADPYAVPDSNPFVAGGGRPEVYLYGVRNPWRFSFDPATGDLWVADVGQGAIEEIDRLPAVDGAGLGANLGWPLVEGTRPFDGSATPDLVPPVFEYGHDQGRCSVTGGAVYRGGAIEALAGAYVYGDYCSGEVWGLAVGEGDPVNRDLGVTVEDLTSFGVDADGELYLLSDRGPVYRLVAA